MLQISDLTLSYKKGIPTLKKLNLSLKNGDVIAVIGENGVGKSTLIKAIAGLISFDLGTISIKGKDLKTWDLKELSKVLVLVASKQSVSGLLSVEEFVAFGRYPFASWYFKQSPEDNKVIEQSLKNCGISHLAKKNINEISDGERQKVFLAKALAQNTELLLLDEPTSYLDIKSSRAILKLICTLKEEGKTIIFSSHQVRESIEIATKLWLVNNKEVIELTPDEFKKSVKYQKIIFGE